MSYMEDQVLAYKAPLYGRRTAQFKVQPFEFPEACKYFTQFSNEDKALGYGIVGGTPQYLLQLNDKLSIEDNIKNTYLNPASSIYEEPQNLLKQDAIDFTDIGRWWGTNPQTRQQVEIDIMGTADKNTVLFAECKWTNENVDLGVLESLIEKSKLFHYGNKHYYLFAKTGFTKGCMDKADEMENVTLVSYEDMLK